MPEFEVIAGDMFDEIGRVEPASCRCALIDPPYMIGTQSVHRDNMIDPWADLMNGARFYREVIDAVRPKLTKDGAMWLFMNWRGLPAIYKASCDAKWLPASCMVWSKDWPGTGDPLRASHELCLLYTCEGFKRPNAKTLDVQTCKPVPTAHRVHSAEARLPAAHDARVHDRARRHGAGLLLRIRFHRRRRRVAGTQVRRHRGERGNSGGGA